MHIKKSLEKVMEWQSAAAQLKPHVPYGDRVLSTWFTTLQEFKKDLPLLHRLSNEALKVCTYFLTLKLEKGPAICRQLISYTSDHVMFCHSPGDPP